MAEKKKLICFSGLDGSGKTTLAKEITNFLIQKNFPVIYVYGRFQLLLTKPMVFIGNKLFLRNYNIKQNYEEYTSKKKTSIKNHRYISDIYLYALLIDYMLQLLIKIKIPLILGKIVVCDRYVYDTIITDFAVDMNFSRNRIIYLIERCFLVVPKPEISFIVDVHEDVAYSRKNDIPHKQYLKDRRDLYLEIGKYYNMAILDGNKQADEVLTKCITRLENEFNI